MAKDPYKYFRIEAREIVDGLKQGALDLEKAPSAEIVGRLLRLAHTLKGAARVVKLPAIAEQAHGVEDVLEPHRASGEVPHATIDTILRVLDRVSEAVIALDAPGKATPTAPRATETVRIEIAELDRLLAGLLEATAQLNALRSQSAALDGAHGLAGELVQREGRTARGSEGLARLRTELADVRRTLSTGLEQIGVELLQARDAAARLRLAPALPSFGALERAVRDAAQSLGKDVRFVATGGETRLDAHVLAALSEALLHVVRNAVAHGIAKTGTVALAVSRENNRIVFACTDDGRGVDVVALRRIAVSRGARPQDVATDDAVIALLLEGGMTTTKTVTDVSGRGVGLDVVREIVTRLKGEVRVRTAAGAGATFEIRVPISLTSRESLRVSAGGVTGSIPLDAIEGTLRVDDGEIARSGSGDSLLRDGKLVPFMPLARILRREAPRRRSTWSAVVVRSRDGLAAIGVDRLLGTSDVVVSSLPSALGADAAVVGASLDVEGNPELAFDPDGLAHAARTFSAETAVPDRERLPILVVDDSLTTRMLEQSILESAGYAVELATSGEEALEKARKRTFGAFVVDVEMPGMDGYEFVSRTRQDAVLGNVPAILVTSRGSDEDRARGRTAGATAYIVKGEFDQALLLRTIHGIIG
jgi:two-component system, chemotaxis family, sensor kinase CheA